MKNPTQLVPCLLAVAWLGLAPMAYSVTPPPDGGYPNFNTAEGEDALFSLTTGVDNTGIGYQALFFNTSGNKNTAIGDQALFSNAAGNRNTAVGSFALTSNTTGFENTAVGVQALLSNTRGQRNTAVGVQALQSNIAGDYNTALGRAALSQNNVSGYNTGVGDSALYVNVSGIFNTAVGAGAMEYSEGSYNTAVGYSVLQSVNYARGRGDGNTGVGAYALDFVTTGSRNTAIGLKALGSNSTGSSNSAIGGYALSLNTTGGANTTNGYLSLRSNTTGSANTASGASALALNTTGSSNTAEGSNALYNNTTGRENTATGRNALYHKTTGDNNIAVGFAAGRDLTTGSNNIYIGNLGAPVEDATIRVGTAETHQATFIAGIFGVTVPDGVPVVIDTKGRLGTITSSARFKEAIQPMKDASETIFSLQPVTFRYKESLDPGARPQFGLVAEEVAKVDPALVARDEQGKPYTVRYEAVNAMLLNEFLKEHRKGEQQDHKIKQLQATVASLQSALKAQAAQIRQVSDDLSRISAPRLVENR